MAITDSEIASAAAEFWTAREHGTQAARHDRIFLELLARELTSLGWPAQISRSFNDTSTVIAGHFRAAKSWDVVCRDSADQPRICIEFKSQVDSYGNNENNRYEEALGSGLDVRAHAHDRGAQVALGFFFVICDEPASRSITRERLPDLDPAFASTSHVDRRIVFAQRIVEYELNGLSLYDAAAVLLIRRDGTVEHPLNPDLHIANFPGKLAQAAGMRL